MIVYCISRNDTEKTADWLNAAGRRTQPRTTPACLSGKRQRIQDRFMQERCNVIVATVAFGMGIDRSDVRCVVHPAMPKSIEHYQQEAGRAGRDGLPAECGAVVFLSADVSRWKRLMERSAAEVGEPGPPEHQLEMLAHMQRFCTAMKCRHAALAEYFGQTVATPCGACDVCLGENAAVDDSSVVAQKIISCVARLEGRFGAGHVVSVLRGANTEKIRRMRHAELSVYGLMRETPTPVLNSFVDQLIDAGALARSDEERPIVHLTEASREFLKATRPITLHRPNAPAASARQRTEADWSGVDHALFESLRALRREIAEERSVPAYVIFGDQTLCDLRTPHPAHRPRQIFASRVSGNASSKNSAMRS